MSRPKQINVQQATQYAQLVDPTSSHRFGWAIKPIAGGWHEKPVAPFADIITAARSLDLSQNSVFICPAPRNPSSKTRKSMDAAPCQVVWVDYDAQKADKPFPHALLKKLEPYLTIVESGTPGNLHIYGKLLKPVKCRDLRILNFAMAEAFSGDIKWSDESLLRLPGSFNPKTEAQRPVRITQQATDSISASELLSILLAHTEEHVTLKFCAWATREKTSGRTLTGVDADIPSLLARVRHSLASTIQHNRMPVGNDSDESLLLHNFLRDLYKNSDLDEDEAYTLIQTYDPFMDRLGHRADKEISKVWYMGENDPKRREAREKFIMGKDQGKTGELFMLPKGPDELVATVIAEHLVEKLPNCYTMNGELCVIRHDRDQDMQLIHTLTSSKLIMQLNKYFPMYTKRKNDETDEYEIVRAPVKTSVGNLILSMLEWPEDMQPIRGLSPLPFVIRRDGTVSAERGYDPDTRYYYTSTDTVSVPTAITRRDVEAAKKLIFDEVLYDIPWRDPDGTDEANFFAMMMTPVLTHYLGNIARPAGAIDANHAGSGKTMMAKLLATPFVPGELGLDRAEEMAKSIPAALNSEAPVIQIDNVRGAVSSPLLERLFTAKYWDYRILGTNRNAKAVNDKFWVFTGNNISFAGDLARRMIVTRLVTGVNPERRDVSKFRIPNLSTWLNKPENAMSVYRALVILGLDWINAGAPRIPVNNADFSEWTSIMAGLTDHHGLKNFFSNRDEVMDDDEEKNEWGAFLEAWYRRWGSDGITVAQIMQLKQGENDLMWTGNFLEEIMSAPAGSAGKKLGRALAAHKDQVFGQYQLLYHGMARANKKQYRVEKLKKNKVTIR